MEQKHVNKNQIIIREIKRNIKDASHGTKTCQQKSDHHPRDKT